MKHKINMTFKKLRECSMMLSLDHYKIHHFSIKLKIIIKEKWLVMLNAKIVKNPVRRKRHFMIYYCKSKGLKILKIAWNNNLLMKSHWMVLINIFVKYAKVNKMLLKDGKLHICLILLLLALIDSIMTLINLTESNLMINLSLD